jgi:hypothetical protein
MALQQSSELRDLFSRFYQAMEAGDASQALELVSREQGGLSIGTDPAEWWNDYATLERVYAAQLPEMRAAGVRFLPGEVACYQEGTVGWCADRPRILLPDGTEQSMRLTAVFHKEEDTWKMVQSHASFGVPNTDALGTDLTT